MNTQSNSLKIVLLGNICVGKTCILLRFSENVFIEEYQTTIGLNYKVKQMQLHNKHTVKVQIWDTSGQERFLSLTKNFLKGSNGAVIVFDITDRKSFEDLEQWIESIKENIDIDTLPIVLLGNKVDLECNRQVSTEEAEHLAKAEKFKYFETSSKNNTGIDEAFQYLAEEMYKVVHTNSSIKGKITINDKKKKKKKCCK